MISHIYSITKRTVLKSETSIEKYIPIYEYIRPWNQFCYPFFRSATLLFAWKFWEVL